MSRAWIGAEANAIEAARARAKTAGIGRRGVVNRGQKGKEVSPRGPFERTARTWVGIAREPARACALARSASQRGTGKRSPVGRAQAGRARPSLPHLPVHPRACGKVKSGRIAQASTCVSSSEVENQDEEQRRVHRETRTFGGPRLARDQRHVAWPVREWPRGYVAPLLVCPSILREVWPVIDEERGSCESRACAPAIEDRSSQSH